METILNNSESRPECIKSTDTEGFINRGRTVAFSLAGGLALGMIGLLGPFIYPALRKICLPFVPATPEQIKNVVALLKKCDWKRTEKAKSRFIADVIDLGSGDGRIVNEIAKSGLSAVGIELNPWLVAYSKYSASRLGTRLNAKFYVKDIFKTDLSQFKTVVIFGTNELMPTLEIQLEKQLGENCSVIACRYPLPSWKPVHVEGTGIDKAWLYQKKIQ